jgi:hypothetical protein
MEISPEEIETIDEIGSLDSEPVKMVKTRGGFYMGLSKRKGQTMVLAAGSHPGLVKYNIEKQFDSFKPSLAKSEKMDEYQIIGNSELLDKSLRDKGYDLVTMKKGNEVNYVVTRFGSEFSSVKGEFKDNSLVLQKSNEKLNSLPNIGISIGKVCARDAVSKGKAEIILNGRSFDAKKMV